MRYRYIWVMKRNAAKLELSAPLKKKLVTKPSA